MTYATLREALYDFFTHNAPLVSDGDYYSSEDVFTALPYAKGRRYFDAVALTPLSGYWLLFLALTLEYGVAAEVVLERKGWRAKEHLA